MNILGSEEDVSEKHSGSIGMFETKKRHNEYGEDAHTTLDLSCSYGKTPKNNSLKHASARYGHISKVKYTVGPANKPHLSGHNAPVVDVCVYGDSEGMKTGTGRLE